MLVSCAWLHELCPVTAEPRLLAEALTARGITVDAVLAAGDDVVLDLDVAANRPDCLGHLGVARELSARFGVALAARPLPPEGEGSALDALVAVEDEARCPRFTASLVRGVRVGPSPASVVARLQACGLRSVNNAVDVSNLVMLELGQPVHFYDASTLAERRLVVRAARPGETLVTLDGIERRLDPQVLVIADARAPVGLAGILGGSGTGITEGTTEVLIEAASFDPSTVRRTARRLGIASDAAYRFERGVDPNAVHPAQDLALRLLVELCGGTAAPGRIEIGSAPPEERLRLRQARAARLLGLDPGPAPMEEALTALALRPAPTADGFEVTVPSWRKDLLREVDLIEEIARHLGYDRIPERRPNRISPRAGRGEPPLEERVRDLLAHAGFHETLSYAMVAEEDDAAMAEGPSPAVLRLRNPMSETQAVLRRSLLPGLLRAADANLRRGVKDVRLFEVGHVFAPGAPGIAEASRAGLAWAGAAEARHWSRKAQEVGFHDVAGGVESVLGALRPGLEATRRPAALPGLHPGQTVEWIGPEGRPVARAGRVHPDLAHALDLETPIYVGEVELSALAGLAPLPVRAAGVPRVAPVSRDLSLVLPLDRPWTEIASLLGSVPAPAPAAFEVVDRYLGPPLPEDRISLTVRVILQPFERSLQEAEIEGFRQALVEILQARLGVALRA